MLCWNLCLLSTISCFAFEWLFQSLWSRQQRCKMAAARDIYMQTLNGSNSTCSCDECYVCGHCWCSVIHMNRLGSFDTDFCYWFKDLSVDIVAEIRFTQSVFWQSSLCMLLLSVPCWIDCRRKKRVRIVHLLTVFNLLHVCFPWTDLQRLVLMSSFYQNRTFCTSSGQRDVAFWNKGF